MINKDILKHLIAIVLKNKDITKTYHVEIFIVSQYVKFYGLTAVLREPEDDNKIHKYYVKCTNFT